ncbi:MAG: enoyl-CoA hydratase/isomerase family protein [Thermoleophilaceae bacterium]|jgi:enoyl-CoA hydratase/3-hydroxyacyl-CoA dehydrogenase|nr:enoyl-CoA hydratase/isomerase family protein [Thermoleophilaceae bacterium]
MTTQADTARDTVVERFQLKALVESCLLIEEDVAGIKDIDLGVMTGAGIIPGPLARADERGLDEVLSSLERARSEWGEEFAPPLVLRRLVAQGRLGRKTGQGFFPYSQPDSEWKTIQLEERHGVAIVWLNRPPTNPVSPQVLADLSEAWSDLDGHKRAVVIASSSPFAFSAGADIREFREGAGESQEQLVDTGHRLMRSMERSSTVTIAAVNGVAFGAGCELAMACDFRVAARSATFGQPEIKLGLIPGLGGTQRLPRLVGEGKALEMNLTGEPIPAEEALRAGLVSQVVPDHELFDAALSWARKLSDQAPMAIERIKAVSHQRDLDEGLGLEQEAFSAVFPSEDGREGISAFLEKRTPRFRGR